MPAVEVEAEVRVKLPPFKPFSPMSTDSKGEAQLKVCLTRLQLEAQEKAQRRQGQLDLRLQIRTLEIEAEKQVKMRQLELEAMRIEGGSAAQPGLPRDSTPAPTVPSASPVPPLSPVSIPPAVTEAFNVSTLR